NLALNPLPNLNLPLSLSLLGERGRTLSAAPYEKFPANIGEPRPNRVAYRVEYLSAEFRPRPSLTTRTGSSPWTTPSAVPPHLSPRPIPPPPRPPSACASPRNTAPF